MIDVVGEHIYQMSHSVVVEEGHAHFGERTKHLLLQLHTHRRSQAGKGVPPTETT